MLSPEQFAGRLLDWFDQHGRHDLPWQHPRTPYRVWLSEIMLQQTQVATVIPYFQRFEQRFGDVHALARASDDDVMQLWSGLGYYARARNLKKAAVQVSEEHGGVFPDTVEALTDLPGIGRSTAGAIRSLGYGKRAAILDGNVKRVLARMHCIAGWPGKSAVLANLWEIAEQLTPTERVTDYNQAMMDLGATVCTRSRPACERCPFDGKCAGQGTGEPERFPGKKPRKKKPQRSTVMLIVRCADQLLLERRPPSGIWGGLWSLPEINSFADNDNDNEATDSRPRRARHANIVQLPLPEHSDAASIARHSAVNAWLAYYGVAARSVEPLAPLSHSFSHYDLAIAPLLVNADSVQYRAHETDMLRWFGRDEIDAIGLPAPVAKLLTTKPLKQEDLPL